MPPASFYRYLNAIGIHARGISGFSQSEPCRYSQRQLHASRPCSKSLFLIHLFTWTVYAATGSALELEGIAQAGIGVGSDRESFINSGTGLLRYDEDGVRLQQSALRISQDLSSAFSAEATVNAYTDGDLHLGFTQAFLTWKPLSPNPVRLKARAGFFYPRMSKENTDVGWLSTYSYTPSAINSWIGEELRTAGAEFAVFSPGRARRSPWSWELNGAVYWGNDPIASALAWRGFATHDRQSLHHDRLQFAPIPAVIDPEIINSPAWVEPFHEVDGRPGFYLGAHLRKAGGTDFRVYLYDNNADPLAINSQRLYAWDTQFLSAAVSHPLASNTELLGQLLYGQTCMGDGLVGADFQSAYLMLSHRFGANRIAARIETNEVDEDDRLEEDPNDSDGTAFTVAWRRELSSQWEVGAEYLWNRSYVENRETLGESARAVQSQFSLVFQYRFGH